MLKYIHITLKSSAMDFHMVCRSHWNSKFCRSLVFWAGETYKMTPKEFAVKKSACRFFTHPKKAEFRCCFSLCENVRQPYWNNARNRSRAAQLQCGILMTFLGRDRWMLSESARLFWERPILVSAFGKDLELFCLESVVNLWINRAKWMYM